MLLKVVRKTLYRRKEETIVLATTSWLMILKHTPNPAEIGGKVFIDFSEFRFKPIKS